MKVSAFLLLILLTSCGYQLGQGKLSSEYETMTIPYICGDTTGEITSALIKDISRSGAFHYSNSSGQLCLKVAIIEFIEDNVGYEYGPRDDDDCDCDRKGKVSHSIIPNETRITAVAEVSVVDSRSGCIKLGPGRIYASYVFDHDYYFSPEGINQTSLGQLTNMESAREAVIKPLSEVLARKITDYVIYSW